MLIIFGVIGGLAGALLVVTIILCTIVKRVGEIEEKLSDCVTRHSWD